MAGPLLLAGDILSMTSSAADRLLKGGDGDAGLLYLFLLRRGGVFEPELARKTLNWSNDRLLQASQALSKLGLWDGKLEPVADKTPPEPKGPPEYSIVDITREKETAAVFSHLVDEMETKLGKLLSTTDLKTLYTLYDYLALPAEVILMLTTWCGEEVERKHGQGQRPKMPQIRKEAFVWHRLGVDTPEAADIHIRHLSQVVGREKTLLPLLGISGRQPVEEERKYIRSWIEQGFDDPSIHLAYEKTILQTGQLKWKYMASILRSWHQKGLHTLEEIQKKDSTWSRSSNQPSGGSATAPAQPQDNRQAETDMERMRRFLAQQNQSNQPSQGKGG